MMKILLVFLVAILLPSSSYSLCPSGCSCFNDDTCTYYCNYGYCQSQIPIGGRCSGYNLHPRECGSGYYCDPYSNVCQSTKSNGEWCMYSYSCISEYCDTTSNTCRTRYTVVDNWIVSILMPSIIVFILLIIIFIIIIVRRQRRQTFGYYHNPYVVLPSGIPYSYQNSYPVGESPPPPYPGASSTPLPKTYQG